MKKFNVGILGLGTVGGGTYDILTNNQALIEKRTGVKIQVTKALARSRRGNAPDEIITDDPDQVILISTSLPNVSAESNLPLHLCFRL